MIQMTLIVLLCPLISTLYIRKFLFQILVVGPPTSFFLLITRTIRKLKIQLLDIYALKHTHINTSQTRKEIRIHTPHHTATSTRPAKEMRHLRLRAKRIRLHPHIYTLAQEEVYVY